MRAVIPRQLEPGIIGKVATVRIQTYRHDTDNVLPELDEVATGVVKGFVVTTDKVVISLSGQITLKIDRATQRLDVSKFA